ncbi:cyclic nucleotide-binding domain-containing protein [bacterium]|nr:cyclic nucleotide-binding domain-containing protein [bacterium]
MVSKISGDKLQEVTKILKNSGLGRELADEEIAKIANLAVGKSFIKNSRILREDSKSRDLFMIADGRVSVRLKLPSEFGREEAIYQIREGQVFGELSLVDGSPRSATVYADDDVETFQFDHTELMQLLEDNPRIGFVLMRNLASIIAHRVRNTNMLWRNSLVW